MKRFFFSLIALAAVAASCTQSALVETPDLNGTEITFNPYTGRTPVTKASAILGADGLAGAGGFQVLSLLTKNTTTTTYMNGLVTGSTSGQTTTWTYQGSTAYWPDESTYETTTLSFVAYSANALGQYSITEGETTTNANLIDWTTGKTNEEFTFHVPTKVSEQIDLLATNYQQGLSLRTNTDGNVTLNFNHLLSRIGFQVVANQDKDNRDITISSLVFTGNIPTQGVLELKAANTADAIPALTYTDEMVGAPEYQLLSEAFITPSSKTAAEITDDVNGRYMMIMPHTANDAKIKVTYQIEGMSTTRNAVVEIPNTQVFAPGKAYEFILKISTSAITFGVVEEEWNTDHDQSEVDKPVVPGDNNVLTVVLTSNNTEASVSVKEGEYTQIGIQRKIDDGQWADLGDMQGFDAETEAYDFSISTLNAPNTTYSVRAYAINAVGEKVYSKVSTYTTLPNVTTGAASEYESGKKATLSGTFPSGQGKANVKLGFRYSKSNTTDETTGALTDDPSTLQAAENVASFSKLVEEKISPNVTYYYQAYAENDGGRKYGEFKSFKTPILAPVVSTNDITSIASTTATFNGSLTDNGGDSNTKVGFIFSKTNTLTSGALTGTKVEAGSVAEGNGAFALHQEGLGMYVTYYVQAYAENDFDENGANPKHIVYSDVKEFRTLAEKPITTIEVTEYAKNTASFKGETTKVGTEAASTECGFIYSMSNTLTNDALTGTTVKASNANQFTANVSGLSANTTYYVQAYTKNAAGLIGYSKPISFTTSESDDPILDWGDNGTGGGEIDDPDYNKN
ncbi:MAG: fimbrillin family protein [Bacteroidales bacterium]|nr:fimbrillin family protein [Bacteroidales bacterium]